MSAPFPWERALGARVLADGEQTEFRVWAPRAEQVELEVGSERRPMGDCGFGVYEAFAPVTQGADYRFVLDGEALPDPASP